MAELESHVVPTDVGKLRVRVCGEGPAVLLWPNHYLTGLSWRQTADAFADRRTMIMLDPPGHGGSDVLDRDITMAECAAVVDEIITTFELDALHVVGNGWGAQVALVAGALYRDRIASLVLINSSTDPSPRRRTVRARTFQRLYGSVRPLRPVLARRLLRRLLGRTSFERRRTVVAQVRNAIRSADPVSVRHAIRDALHRRSEHSTLATTVHTPTLVIACTQDRTVPVDDGVKLAASLRNSAFMPLGDAGHSPQLEAPEKLNEILAEFWSEPRLTRS